MNDIDINQNEIKSTVTQTKAEDSLVKADPPKMKELTDHILSLLTSQFDSGIDEFERLIGAIGRNYISETSTEIQNKFNTLKENNAPGFRKAIMECSKYVNEEVTKFYADTENKAAESVGSSSNIVL